MIKNPWLRHQRNSSADNVAIKEFLEKGGKVKRLRIDDGLYDKMQKKKSAIEGFNPFTKEDHLEK